jgi:hypothetical protein
MGITGNLKTMALSELLQWLSLGLKTGTLQIQGHGIEKRIYFQDGKIASSSSSDQREYLGHFLVSHGYITEEELKMAMEVQEESSILLGKILVMINAISETDLLDLMRKKAEESIFEIFLWEEGDFEFIDNEIPPQKMVPLSLDVTGIIMEGLRRLDEWRHIREQVPSLAVIPRIVRALQLEKLTDQEKLIVPYLNGHRTLEEIAIHTHNPEFVVARMVFDGVRNGTMALEERTPPEPEPMRFGESVADEVDHFLRRGRALLAESPEKAWRIFKAATELDPSDGRPRDALRQAEEKLLATLAKDGIDPNRIPILKIPVSDLTRYNFTPNEGFVISRINGTWDVKSIMKISPIREMEVLLTFKKLAADGVVGWKREK